MKDRLLAALLVCLILTCGLLSGCKKDGEAEITPLPVATKNPNITHPKGQYYKVQGKQKAEGALKVLGSDFMRVMIEGKEVEFALTENAQREISIYNKDKNHLMLMQGTMLLITYRVQDLVKFAESIDILTAN